MKKGQSGVSLIALVITIIVVIILAAVAFGTSTRTITNANWSTFANAVGEVRTAFQERVTTVKGEEAAKSRTRTDAQVYNFVAKDGVTRGAKSGDNNAAWLSRSQANTLSATRIEPDVLDGELNLRNRNKIKVNTSKGSGIEVAYFVTRNGDVFVWPPYEYEDKFYVNPDTEVYGDTETSIVVGGVTVKIDKAKVNFPAADVTPRINGSEEISLANTEAIYWVDGTGAALPKGLESDAVYNDGSAS